MTKTPPMIKYTDLKATNRHDLREVLPLGKPYTLLIEPSSICNFRCIQCFQSIKTDSYFLRNRINMSMALFQKVIEQMQEWNGPKLKVLKLSLYGEPLLNRHFCEMLGIARKADVAERIETTTNASMLSRVVAEEMVNHQLDYIRVSIYASEQGRHNDITGSTLDIRIIHENLRILQEVKQRLGSDRPFVSCKMIEEYGTSNDEFFNMYRDVSDEMYLDKPHGWIKVDGLDFIENYYEDDVGKARRDLQLDLAPRIACPLAFTTMAVRSNGDISPCCVDFCGGTNLGNIATRGLEELWNSEEWYAFQKMQLENRKHENSSCKRCEFYLSEHYTKDNIDGFELRRSFPAPTIVRRTS